MSWEGLQHWYATSLYHQRYRLVGKEHPHLVSYVGQVEGAGQQHLRVRSKAGVFKQDMLGAGQDCLINKQARHMD